MCDVCDVRDEARQAIIKRREWPARPKTMTAAKAAEEWEQFKVMTLNQRHEPSGNLWAERSRLIDTEMIRPTERELQIIALHAGDREPGSDDT